MVNKNVEGTKHGETKLTYNFIFGSLVSELWNNHNHRGKSSLHLHQKIVGSNPTLTQRLTVDLKIKSKGSLKDTICDALGSFM